MINYEQLQSTLFISFATQNLQDGTWLPALCLHQYCYCSFQLILMVRFCECELVIVWNSGIGIVLAVHCRLCVILQCFLCSWSWTILISSLQHWTMVTTFVETTSLSLEDPSFLGCSPLPAATNLISLMGADDGAPCSTIINSSHSCAASALSAWL